MPDIAEYLAELEKQRTQLAKNLNTMGVRANATEKLNTLVSKVLQIQHSGSGTVKENVLLDTNSFTSKQETVSAYGESIYIYESTSAETLQKYADVIEKWGGISSSNNFVSDASAKYGIAVSNWSESESDTGILFVSPLELSTGKLLITINASLNSWMNQNLHLNLIRSEGTVADMSEKITDDDFTYTFDMVFAGSTSLKDHILNCGNIIAGTYYLYISGTEKADNSNFSYNKIEYLNY
ncbi:MAG: hypothetical protein NC205_00420 [Prevotella sp.]|nr:hypothetical protein [Alistipes senegalensis]MCM1357026.1 hypothetical protein [Prevotella sp.]MCM1472603.1 hypothetical protein [Muribaculaceae bacterium]